MVRGRGRREGRSGRMAQNTYAVAAQRVDPADSADYFPTPPWGARALCEYVIGPVKWPASAWEPACGAGHMARPLAEYFEHVDATDLHGRGYGDTGVDFLNCQVPEGYRPDWVITNPPFNLAIEFAERAISVAGEGVALLARTAWAETGERYKFFSTHRPALIAQFMGRLPMHKGKCERGASTATAYAWFVWRGHVEGTRWVMIPPCARTKLERWGDYDGETGPKPTTENRRTRT